ncbi:MAG: MarR family transcriptional regulator [Chloroflexota bacterium]|nr:MarR family transcriptional regulator [Chloroflexota bacterium]
MMSSIGGERQARAMVQVGEDVCASPGRGETRYQELQAELEYRLAVLVDQLRARIAAVAGELGLTLQQGMLLRHLGQPKTMGDIAVAMACDRSNVTGLVDRLATRGLVERVADPGDRRIKYLVLTDAGRTHRAALQERLLARSLATDALVPSERRQLLLLLRKLTPEITGAERE